METQEIENRSGQLTDEQLYGCPPPGRGYRQLLTERYTVCPVHKVPCPAMNEYTGECMAKVCVLNGE